MRTILVALIEDSRRCQGPQVGNPIPEAFVTAADIEVRARASCLRARYMTHRVGTTMMRGDATVRVRECVDESPLTVEQVEAKAMG